ncbi:MAG: hypothetical protein JW882_08825 [Deltaproteobacteria bacterium]|nr:hypothetical protein [Deltaproteobacteria bacterium]
MSSKYMIHTRHVPNRFKPVTRSGIIAWEEGCLKCAECVKKQCIYGVYDHRELDVRQMIDSIDNQCKSCYRCVQSCPKELIQKSLNPEFLAMGDPHWTPDIITRLWYQAETGKIPVSGAGYPGPFIGPGFDSMWTDMSEIVRPTRDGIHGREYISTAVDLGRSPGNLVFTETGDMETDEPDLVDIPLPIILRVPTFGSLNIKTLKGWGMAARRLGTFLALPLSRIEGDLLDLSSHLIPVAGSETKIDRSIEGVRIIEILWDKNWENVIREVRKYYPSALLSIRLPMIQGVEENIIPLLDSGFSIINLDGSFHGRSRDNESCFVKDGIRDLHMNLVEKSIRDQITLISGGGFAMAEQVAKGLICGADAICVDFPILIALECRMCRRCEQGLPCPVDIEQCSSKWVASRTVNLISAWHGQILEVMGAMGIRDARRLRGEVGRAIFYDDLDHALFGSLNNMEEGYEIE